MRKSWLQLYAPFLVLALVQALLIVVAPSRGESTGLSADGALQGVAGAPLDSTATASPTSPPTAPSPTARSPTAATGRHRRRAPAAPAGTGGGRAGPAAPGRPATPATARTASRSAGCASRRRASRPSRATTAAPPTRASPTRRSRSSTSARSPTSRWTPSSPRRASRSTRKTHMDAVNQFVKFINEHYELYGRKIVIKRIVGDCPTTPPDYDKCNAAAQQVVKEKPFAVVWATSLYATVYDIWARAGILELRREHLRRQLLQPQPAVPVRPRHGRHARRPTTSPSTTARSWPGSRPTTPARPSTRPSAAAAPSATSRSSSRRSRRTCSPPSACRARSNACNGGDPAPMLRTYKSDIETADAADAGHGVGAHRRQGHHGRVHVRPDRAGVPHRRA